MGRKLCVFLSILALSLVSIGTGYCAVENIKINGYIEMLALSRYGFDLGSSGDGAADERDDSGLASILKLGFTADLTEDVTAHVILFNERVWKGTTETGSGDILLGGLWVTLKDFLNYPVTLKIGKQRVVIGSGLIVSDVNTNFKGSSTFKNTAFADLCGVKTFEGLIATFDYSPLIVNLGALKLSEGDTGANDDRNLYILDLNYDLTDNTTGEFYYILDDRKKVDIGNIGARVVSSPVENLTLSLESAYQYQKYDSVSGSGPRPDKHSSDWAILASATYSFNGWVPMSIGVDYTRITENWDPMYEEITPADIVNAILPNSNYQAIGATFKAALTDDISLMFRYANLRLVKKVSSISGDDGSYTYLWSGYSMTDDKDLGNEVDLHLTYDYTEDVQFSLLVGYFNPGDAFADSNDDDATQVIGKLKVTF